MLVSPLLTPGPLFAFMSDNITIIMVYIVVPSFQNSLVFSNILIIISPLSHSRSLGPLFALMSGNNTITIVNGFTVVSK